MLPPPDRAFHLFPNPEVERHFEGPGTLSDFVAPPPALGLVFDQRWIDDLMEDLVQAAALDHQRVAVLLVDMQGERTPPEWRRAVGEQLHVLDRAIDLELAVYQIRYAIPAREQEFLPVFSRHLRGYPRLVRIRKDLGNSLSGIDEADLDSGREPLSLREYLQATRVGVAIVLGQEVNYCVLCTIFGQYDERPRPPGQAVGEPPYHPGLLDIGCTVVSSLDVLIGAERADQMAPIYRFRPLR